MMTYANDVPDLATDEALRADAEVMSAQTITLSPEILDRACDLSQAVRSNEQWQAYQNAIALFGFQEWLAERGIDITAELGNCSVYGGAIAGLLSGVCQLQVNDIRVCLLPISSLTEDWIAVPRATLELEAYIPQLFIGIEVREERQQVIIWGSLRLNTLTAHQASSLDEIPTDADWTYCIPRQWFNADPDAILLYLRCLAANAIPTRPVCPSPQRNLETFQSNLPLLRHRLQSFEQAIWKLLSWSQASLVLENLALAKALLSKAPINASNWFQNQLDNLAQSFNWQLLPPLTALRGGDMRQENQAAGAVVGQTNLENFSPDLRSSVEQFEDVVSELSMSELEVPSYARATMLDLPFGEHEVRLYVIIWDSSTLSQPQEWSLTAILGIVPDTSLPETIHLIIADETEQLDEQHILAPTAESYLCSKVIGDWRELFWITIDVEGCESLTLPPFTYFPTTEPTTD